MRLQLWNGAMIGAALTVASVLAAVPANAGTKYNWSFTDQSSTVVGSGTLEMTDNIIITKMTGNLFGKKILFYPNKPNPWTTPVPNGLHIETNNPVPGNSQVVGFDGGLNTGYDDIYNFNDGITYYGGIFLSTGTGAGLQEFEFARDSANYTLATPTDLLTFTGGWYTTDEGTFTVTAAP
jgi:hypothetical protein